MNIKENEKLEQKQQDQKNLRKDIQFIKKNILIPARKDAETAQSCYIY